MTLTARRYTGVPLVCDRCGQPAQSSVSGGRGGHTQVCDACRDQMGRDPRKVAVDGFSSVDEIADELLRQVSAVEPRVTRDMQRIVSDLGGKMKGLEFRIKGRDSLVRKLHDRASSKNIGGMELANAVQDVLRYTMIFGEEIYAVQTQMALAALVSAGYQEVEVQNYWVGRDDYQGINSNFRVPGTNIVMELQFHTDASHRLKEEDVHRLYEQYRTLPSGSGVKKMIFDVMTRFWDHVKTPAGVGGVGSPAMHASPPGIALYPADTVALPEWLRAARLISWGVRSGLRSTAARDALPVLDPADARANGWHLASDDYPELSKILWERPDLVHAEVSDPFMRMSLGKVAAKPSPDPIGDSIKDPKQPWWWRKIVGPAVERFNDNLPPGYQTTDLSEIPAVQWCRFRRDGHCYFPKVLDEKGSEEAGYAVWVPENRGRCLRVRHDQQKACPVGEPGPDSGEKMVFPDATISWSEGGQRQKRYSSIPVDAITVEAAWTDVRAKARGVQKSGGVRIIANNGMSVTAEVRGEHGIYVSSITRVPGTKQVAISTCSCPWETYRWARSGRWKRLEGRMCSHVTALLYEMQSREFGGGEINEDAGIPIWRTTKPIEEAERKRPGPWRLDRAASREAVRRAMVAHLENISAAQSTLAGDRTRPRSQRDALVALAQIALDSARVDLDHLDGGIPLLPGVVGSIATIEPFRAQVNGRVIEIIEFEMDGGVHGSDGKWYRATQVLYPTYHPSIGLTASVEAGILGPQYGERVTVRVKGTWMWGRVSHVEGRTVWVSVDGLPEGDDLVSARAADVRYEMPTPRKTAVGRGVMIALSPSVEMSTRLSASVDGHGVAPEKPEEIHLTVAYLGKAGEISLDDVLAAMRPVAAALSPISGRIGGLGVFAGGEENVLYASPDIADLHDLRTAVVESLRAKGIEVKSDHGYVPHITLGYSDDPITSLPDFSNIVDSSLLFTTIVVAHGGTWHHLDLVGSSGETVAIERVAAMEEVTGDEDFPYAGVIVRSEDSGRVLMTQRTPFHEDDDGAYGKWEFPGGHVDDGETPLDGALREFSEETGLTLPPEAEVVGVIPTGEYGNFVVHVPHESWTTDAELLTHETMGLGWFDPSNDLADADFVRAEIHDGGALDELSVDAVLHAEPEPALPEAYGSEEPSGEIVPGDPRLAWLMSGGGGTQATASVTAGSSPESMDIAAAAQAYLAKTALRDFTPAEQHEIINEGEEGGVGASNLDRLSIEGTFYADLDAESSGDGINAYDDLMWT